MPILTPLQRSLLTEIGRSSLGKDFFLSGGTALTAFYLQHRYSLDLDFFTANPAALAQVPAVMQDIAARLGAQVTFTRTLGTFLECFIRPPGGDRVELDFAQDNPYRLEPARYHAELGIHIDNPTDIACNKLSALFDRVEPKDFVDVYFVAREMIPFDPFDRLRTGNWWPSPGGSTWGLTTTGWPWPWPGWSKSSCYPA